MAIVDGSLIFLPNRRVCIMHSFQFAAAGGRLLDDQDEQPYDQKPMPPPDGIAGAEACWLGTSATIASVVMSRPATDAAPCRAARTTLVGSIMPFDIMLTYSPDCASKP